MKFNKQIFRFLSEITIGLCEASILNGCVLGMESKRQFEGYQHEKLNSVEKKLIEIFDKYLTQNENKYEMLNSILFALTSLLVEDVKNYHFYKLGLKLCDVLRNIKDWMIRSSTLFKDDYDEDNVILNSKLVRERYIDKYLNVNRIETEQFVGFIFLKILDEIHPKQYANEISMNWLYNMLSSTRYNLEEKWGSIDNLNKEINSLQMRINKLEKGKNFLINNISCAVCQKEIPGYNGPGMVSNCCWKVCHIKCWYDNELIDNCPVCKQIADT